MKLYEIQEALIETLNIFLESECSEKDKEMYEEIMKLLKSELSTKSSNILKYINSLQSDINYISEERKRLDKIKKSKETKIQKLSNYIIMVMTSLEKAKIETDIGNYALRKSTKVEVIDQELIPEKYFKVKIDKTVDKTTLKNILKLEEVPGVKLTTGYSLKIQ